MSVIVVSVVVSVFVLVFVEVEMKPTRLVTVDCIMIVLVGLIELGWVTVVVGTLANDLVPRSVRQLIDESAANAPLSNRGNVAMNRRMLFIVE